MVRSETRFPIKRPVLPRVKFADVRILFLRHQTGPGRVTVADLDELELGGGKKDQILTET